MDSNQRFKQAMSRIVVAAPHSGSGKTTFCMGLMVALVNRGLTVQPCKVGPDYIDTTYHARICGRPASNLDGYLMDWDTLRQVFTRRSADADIAVIEGVMGLYDGMGDTAECSTAEVAKALDAPVLLLVDAGCMAASAAALVKGFLVYDPDVRIAGVVFNNVYGGEHYGMLRRAVERDCGVRCYGYLPHEESAEISSRHLGILPAGELADADRRIQALAGLVESHIDIGGLLALAGSAPALPNAVPAAYPRLPCRVAVARDAAFSFYYDDGLAVLQGMGAELVFFSPMGDKQLPMCDGIYIGGGFPEVFAGELDANTAMRRAIAAASASFMPIYAECGGFMYLTQAIEGSDGKRYEMCGVLPGEAVMGRGLSSQFGYVEVTQRADTPLGLAGTVYRAHEFHHSAITADQTAQTVRNAASGLQWQGGIVLRNTLGSYAHVHFTGEPQLGANFLACCRAFAEARGSGSAPQRAGNPAGIKPSSR